MATINVTTNLAATALRAANPTLISVLGGQFDAGNNDIQINAGGTVDIGAGQSVQIRPASYGNQIMINSGGTLRVRTGATYRVSPSVALGYSTSTFLGANATLIMDNGSTLVYQNPSNSKGSFFSAFEAGATGATLNITNGTWYLGGNTNQQMVIHCNWKAESLINGLIIIGDGVSGNSIMLEFGTIPNQSLEGLTFGGYISGDTDDSFNTLTLRNFSYAKSGAFSHISPDGFDYTRNTKIIFINPSRTDGVAFSYTSRLGLIGYDWQMNLVGTGSNQITALLATQNGNATIRARYPEAIVQKTTGAFLDSDFFAADYLTITDGLDSKATQQAVAPYDLQLSAYGFEIVATTVGTLTAPTITPQVMAADANVTLSESAAGELTSIATVENFYDAAKHWKTRAISAQLRFPTLADQPVIRAGTAVSMGGLNLIVNNGAASAFAVNRDANVITVKSPTIATCPKFNSISTTGTITLTTQASTAGTYAALSASTIALSSGTNYQTLAATTAITGLPTTGTISAAGALGFGSSDITATGDLGISDTALTGTLTISTATARTLTLTNVTGSVTVNVTGGGSLTVVLAGTTAAGAVTTGAGVTKAVQCSVAANGGNSFNFVKRYGTTGAFTDLGYTTGITSDSFLVPLGQPVEVAIWSEAFLTYTRTIPTTNGGFDLVADMIPEPDVDITLDVSVYLANISVTYLAGTFTATFNADMDVPGLESGKAILHRLLGLEGSMRALLPPGISTTVDIEPDEIQYNKPQVILALGAGATNVSIACFMNTAPAKLIDPTYIINPRRASDNLRVEIPLVKPALDVAAMAAAVRAELATELARIDVATSSRSTLAAQDIPEGLTAAEVWSAPIRTLTEAPGLTSGQAEQLRKLAQLSGVGASLVVTPTTRVAGDVSQAITTVDATTTVTEV